MTVSGPSTQPLGITAPALTTAPPRASAKRQVNASRGQSQVRVVARYRHTQGAFTVATPVIDKRG